MSAVATMPFFPSSGAALIASPSSTLREQILHRLNGRCRPVQQAMGGAGALAKLEKGAWQILFLDRRLATSMRGTDRHHAEAFSRNPRSLARLRLPDLRAIAVEFAGSRRTRQ